MKTNKIFMLAIAAGAMFLGSCSNDDGLKQIDEAAKPGTMVFTATMENAGDATRTVLGGTSSTDVYWSSGDTITIFNSDKTSGIVFTADEADGTSGSCTFKGEITETTPYYAVYPAQSGAALSSGTITGVTLPANQTAVAGSYDPAAAIMVARSSDTQLSFKNLNTLIKVTPKFDCTKIILDAKGTQIAGKVNVTPNTTNDPAWAPTSTGTDAKSVVTLTGIIQADSTYYIAILPTTTSGITITFCAVESDDNGNLGYKKEKFTSYTFGRNKIVYIGTFEKSDLDAYQYAGQPQVNKPIVDLGLPSGLCWAKHNVGYESGKPYGDYFSWGYIEPLYSSYTLNAPKDITLTWKSDTVGYYWKYYSYCDSAATITEKSGVTQPYSSSTNTLFSDNDAATQKMDGFENAAWRTPTFDEMIELRQNTVWVFGAQQYGGVSGIYGIKVFRAIDNAHKGYIYFYDNRTGQKGLKWFKKNTLSYNYSSASSEPSEVPAIEEDEDIKAALDAAYREGESPYFFLPLVGYFTPMATSLNASGYYWSSTKVSGSIPPCAYSLSLGDRSIRFSSSLRKNGYSVRGVCEKQQ